MSGNKSWDVQPQRARPARPEPAATARRTAPAPKRPMQLPTGTLKERRKQARRTRTYVLLIVLTVLVVLLLAGVWQPVVRITNVVASGVSPDSVTEVATNELQGTYTHLIPRNSVFFYPEASVRSAILAAHPHAAAVSLQRTGFSTLSVTTTARAPLFMWCGIVPVEGAPEQCYSGDVSGLLFSSEEVPSTGQIVPRIFAPLTTEATTTPAGSYVVQASRLADAIQFVRAIESLGIDISYTVLRDDEADLITTNGTRITYVLGTEDETAATAASALPTLRIPDGGYAYVDLRFSGKAYGKPR